MQLRLILTAIILLGVSNCVGAEPDKELHIKCIYPVVTLLKKDNSFGTAFAIRSQKIAEKNYANALISCAHVTKGVDSEVIIQTYKYENWSEIKEVHIYQGTVYFEDESNDLSIIIFRSQTPIFCCELNFDEKIYVGNDVKKVAGGTLWPRCDFGKITALGIRNYIQVNCPTIQGDSGSPLFYDYKVVGVTKSVHKTFSSSAMVIPLKSLKKTIDDNNNLKFILDHKLDVPKK